MGLIEVNAFTEASQKKLHESQVRNFVIARIQILCTFIEPPRLYKLYEDCRLESSTLSRRRSIREFDTKFDSQASYTKSRRLPSS